MEIWKSTTDRKNSMCKGSEAEMGCHTDSLKMQGKVHVIMLSKNTIRKKG